MTVREETKTNRLGTFRFVRLDQNEPFTCDRCAELRPYKKDKKAKNRAEFTDVNGKKQTLCNGCYGELTAEAAKA